MDSSALVKRYAAEVGTEWIEALLACALTLNEALTSLSELPLVFVTADRTLLAAAQSEGLAVADPATRYS